MRSLFCLDYSARGRLAAGLGGVMFLALASALRPWGPAPVLGQPLPGKTGQVARADGAAPPRRTAPPAPEPAKLRTARAVFERRCQRCHGDDGTGSPVRDRLPEIPNFASGRWQASHSDAQLQVSILDGGTRMPGFRGVISEEQVDALVAQLRSFGPAGSGGASAGDFDNRMRKLDEELKELQRQFRELSRAPQKP